MILKKLLNLLFVVTICCGFAHGGFPTPPAPPGAFAIGGTFSGMENTFPAPPTPASISYLHQKNLNFFRFPLGWGGVNPFIGAVGIQPTPFGLIDTTSTYLNSAPFGNNLVYQSQALASAPWSTFANATGTVSRTNNAGIAPDGSNTATLIQLSRSNLNDFAELFQSFISSAPSVTTPFSQGVWLKARSIADVGKVVTIAFNNANINNVGIIDVTLTDTWVFSPVSTGNIDPGGSKYEFDLGLLGSVSTSLGSTGSINFLAWGFQANSGSSLLSYNATVSGYVQAMDNAVNQAASLGMNVILDIHDFGNGPGLAGAFSITSLTASGTLITATTPAAATLVNGATVTITGAIPSSYDGQFIISNVTTNTFQYTTTIPPPSSPATATIFGGEAAVVGTARLPISAFANLWGQISAHYKGKPGVRGYDLMNEWVNGFDSATVFAANQAAINAIRANGDNTRIYIEGTNFSGAWNWVSGQGQSFNNSNLYLLTDTANNLIFSAHGYPDHDCSGTNYIYSIESSIPGTCPPPISTNPTIQVTRYTQFTQWCVQHSVRCHIGEGAVASGDPIYLGGVGNYQAWNLILQNNLAFAQTNNLEVNIWGGGPEFGPSTPYAGYPFNYEPSSTASPSQKDFSSAGLQSTQMVVLDKFSGFAGAQPLAYSISLPVDGSFNPITYVTSGVPSGNFSINYNAKIIAPVTITPHDTLADGTTPAGGSFSPASIVLATGDNAVATFIYTPSGAHTIRIATTNDRGLIDPPVLGISSQNDQYRNLPSASLTNIYGMYLRYTPSLRPAVRLQRPDGQQLDWGYTLVGSTGFLGFDRVAIQTWSNQRSGIKIVKIYDQSPAHNDITTSGSPLPTLNLSNAADYPEIVFASGAQGDFNTPINGQTLLSVITRMNQDASSGSGLFRQDQFAGPLVFGTTAIQLINTNNNTTVASLGINAINGAYHEYAMSYASVVTNGFKTYNDASIAAQGTVTYAFNPQFGSGSTQLGYFRFAAGHWVGAFTNLELLEGLALTPTQIASFNTQDATYYSTPLPDHLPALNPTIAGATNQFTFSGGATLPFASVVIGDLNTPTPTDTVTITLSGFPATLSGTGITGSNPYTIAAASPASVTATLQAATFTATGANGSVTNIAIAVSSSFGTSANTSITDTIGPASAPAIAGMIAPNVSMDQGAPALWQVNVTDATPSARDSATITLSGAGGTLSHFGPYTPAGGPTVYTFAAMTPTELTRALRNLIWAPTTTTVGTTTTFTIQITNNASLSSSSSNIITNIAPQAMPSSFTPVASPAALPANYNGLNLSGGENTPNPNYAVLNSSGMSWALSKNFTTIRAPFKFYFMVQTANTPPAGYQFYEQFYANFHAADIAALHSAVELARGNGQYIILDDHSFAGIGNPFPTLTQDDPAQPGIPFLIWGADPRVPVSAFKDMWQRTTTYFNSYTNVIMGLQNEPGISGTPWFNMEVAGANGVRAVSSTIPYLISGNNSNVTQFDYTPFTGYVDPAGGPFFFDVHQYFDPGHAGIGNTCTADPITAYFSTFTTWLNTNSYKAFVSEFAWGTDISCEPTLGTSIVAYFNTNSAVYPGWQWWGGGDFPPSYPFYMGPIGSPPQYPLLAPYLP